MIDTKTYIATAKDISALMAHRLEAQTAIGATRNTYLRALIGTTQSRLGLTVLRSKPAKTVIDKETQDTELAMLNQVHEEFYNAVQEVAKATPLDEDETRDKATVLGSRCGFARSSYSTLRNWIVRGNHSLSSIVASRTTKLALANATPSREEVSPKARNRQLRKAPLITKAQSVLTTITASDDKQQAIEALHDVISLLLKGFDELGVDSSGMVDMLDHAVTPEPEVIPARRRRVQESERSHAAA